MSRRYRCVVIGLLAMAVSAIVLEPAAAQRVTDRVRLTRGSDTGQVTNMTPIEVSLSKGAAETRTIPVNEIRSIIFDGEPPELSQARVQWANGGYRDALATLAKIDAGAVQRDFVQQDVQFLKAYCAARLALAGHGEIVEAGRGLNLFVSSHPRHYRYLAAREAMGDLLVATGRFDSAQEQYAELAKAPWPEYKMRAGVAIGRTLQAQEKHAEAITQFDAVIATAADSAEAKSQKLSATLGKAVSMAETGQVDEAVDAIERLIVDADPEEKQFHARAYNALGDCYERAGKTKDALLAYLHVDVVYNSVPDAHAEALARLVPLWKEIGQEARAREAQQLLDERYAGSRPTR